VSLDCDVIQADGGTRTASITGAWVALSDAVQGLIERKKVKRSPLMGMVSAVSVGIYNGECVLDLDYAEDSQAETDMNVVMNDAGAYIVKLVLATGNAGKVRELSAQLAASGVSVLAQSDFLTEEAVEDGLSFVENALIKARHAAVASGLPAVADDSGLRVDALDGAPGVFSAR